MKLIQIPLRENYTYHPSVHVGTRTTYTIDKSQLTIYKTHLTEKVKVPCAGPVLASILRGKLVVHLPNRPAFELLPYDTALMPSDRPVLIDIREASVQYPIQCLSLTISPEKIAQVTDLLNEKSPLVDHPQGWQLDYSRFCFTKDELIQQLINRLIQVLAESNPTSEVLANLVMQELIIRLLQIQARGLFLSQPSAYANVNRLAHVVQYINRQLHRSFSIRELANQACMSEPNFYRTFKQTFGLSPIEYINQQRIVLATNLLTTTNRSLTEISQACGFNNQTYFMKVFRKGVGISPAQYRKQVYSTQ